MSICGIDFGNLSVLIGMCSKGGVDVILNDASNRQTATMVSFQGKQRFIGDAAATIQKSNIKNTISCMKLLVGRRYEEEDVQRELAQGFFKHRRHPSGGVGIEVTYNDEQILVSAEHVLAIMLARAKYIALRANNNVEMAECVLAVPSWFSDSQRRGVLAACEIANVNCLKVMNEGTAIALSYGIYKSAKKLFSESEPQYIMFIDLGYTCYSVTIAEFVQEKLQIRATVTDRNIGGRNFDDVIIEFLASSFQKKFGIDVRKNPKAILKLQTAAEKAKKTLSPQGVNEVNISVECLAEDRDLNALLTKAEFEQRTEHLVQGLQAPIEECLREAGLTKEQLHEVEIVGGSSRINIVKKSLGALLGLNAEAVNYGLKTTMNSDEAVARGAALQCAVLSSRIKVKPFSIIDKVQYPIVVQYDEDVAASSVGPGHDDDDDAEAAATAGSCTQIYSRGDDMPRKPRRLTFRNKTASFNVTLAYAENASLAHGTDRFIARYNVRIPDEYLGMPHDVSLTFNLDRHNCVYVSQATLNKEVISPPAEVKEEEKKSVEGKESEPPAVPKRKFKKVELEVTPTFFGLSKAEIKQAIELEANMANEDRLIVETADARNALESYVFTMRDKLVGPLKDFSTNSEKSQLQNLLQKMEDWLYSDEGYDGTKTVYVKKLNECKELGNQIEYRQDEEAKRGQACEAMKKQIEMCKSFAASTSDSHEHITPEERKKVRDEAESVESWYYDQLEKQSDRASYEDPVLTVASIAAKRQQLTAATSPIMTKPKPKPVPKPAEEKKESSTDDKAKDSKAQEEKKTAEDTSMDTDSV